MRWCDTINPSSACNLQNDKSYAGGGTSTLTGPFFADTVGLLNKKYTQNTWPKNGI